MDDGLEMDDELVVDEEIDSDIEDEVHNNLITNIKQLHGRVKILPTSRSENSTEISVFNLNKPKESSPVLDIEDLLRDIKNVTPAAVDRIRNIQKRFKPLDPPLEKVHAHKIEREVGFDNVKTILDRWDDLIKQNRVADQLKFPLHASPVPEYRNYIKDEDFVSSFRTLTPLEKKMADILNSSEVAKEDKDMEQNDFHLTLGELIQRRKMFAKIRAQASFKIAKAWRQNKIKSKAYHRLLKRDRIKKQLKDFDSLQETDPEEALKQLELIEKSRAKERATLRHRNTGRWAQNQMIRAKYNKESRAALSEQIQKNRELTKKCKMYKPDSSGDEENEEDDDGSNSGNENSELPNAIENEYDQFVSRYQRYQKEEDAKKKDIVGLTNCKDRIIENQSADNRIIAKNHNENSDSGEIECEKKIYTKQERIQSIKHMDKNTMRTKLSINSIQSVQKNVGSETDAILKKSHTRSNGYSPNKKLKAELDQHVPVRRKKCTELSTPSGIFIVTRSDTESDIRDEVDNDKRNEKNFRTINRESSSSDEDTVNNMSLNKGESSAKDNIEYRSDNDEVEVKIASDVAHLSETTDSICRNESANRLLEYTLLKNAADLSGKEKSNSEEYGHNIGIDPSNFLKIGPRNRLNTEIPNLVSAGDDALDDVELDEDYRKHAIISEAFADDDLIAEFKSEKQKTVEESIPKEVSTEMPGWGSWTGGSEDLKHKRKHRNVNRRLLFKIPIAPPRKDSNKGNVIIREEREQKMRQHMVNDLPYPFTSVKEFETSIRVPVGRDWVPETAHEKLIAPSIVTELGTIIQPMDEEELIERNHILQINR